MENIDILTHQVFWYIQILHLTFEFNIKSCDISDCEMWNKSQCDKWRSGYEKRGSNKCEYAYNSKSALIYYNLVTYSMVACCFFYIIFVFTKVTKWHNFLMFLEYIQMVVILRLLKIHYIPESRSYYGFLQFSLVLFDFMAAYESEIKSNWHGGDLLQNFEEFIPEWNNTWYNFFIEIFFYLMIAGVFSALYMPWDDPKELGEYLSKIWMTFLIRYLNITFIILFMSCCLCLYYSHEFFEYNPLMLVLDMLYLIGILIFLFIIYVNLV